MKELPDIPPELLTFLTLKEKECYRLLKQGRPQKEIRCILYFKTQQGVSAMKKRIAKKIINNLLNQ